MPQPPPQHTGLDRRTVLVRLAGFGLTAIPAAALLSGCAHTNSAAPTTTNPGSTTSGGPTTAATSGGAGTPDWMMGDPTTGSGMMDGGMSTDMTVIHDLLVNHDKIRRTVDDLDGGIRAQTTSDDPRIRDLIATHVRAMRARVIDGRPIRQMDPLFREIFKHHTAISMTIIDLPDGVQVLETSTDPQVQLLIRQHAHQAVSQFVATGMPRAMQPTPLPDGYHP